MWQISCKFIAVKLGTEVRPPKCAKKKKDLTKVPQFFAGLCLADGIFFIRCFFLNFNSTILFQVCFNWQSERNMKNSETKRNLWIHFISLFSEPNLHSFTHSRKSFHKFEENITRLCYERLLSTFVKTFFFRLQRTQTKRIY